jgi:NAD(P)-dependent dehydrogenase (short-subunit alcohol dehydrogenase family)
MSRDALKGRVVLVTGASAGLGSHFARILAHSGAAVVLAARRVDRLVVLRDEIVQAGGRAIAVEMDVSDEASTIAAYDTAERAFGTIDTVVANAGIGPSGPALETPVARFAQAFEINVKGAFLSAREGARRMIAAGSRHSGKGRVIIISSITASSVTANLSAYASSKAAVLHLGKHLAREWAGEGVNVNVVQPGYIRTDINDEWFETDAGKWHISTFPRRRLMPAESLDGLILFLASDASEFVTGSTFVVDDGQTP